MGLNFHLLSRRMLGRPTCVCDRTSRITRRARIINIGVSSKLIRVGANSIVSGELLVFPHGGSITIGDWCYVGEGTRVWSGSKIDIGNRVMIAHGVNIFDNQTHPTLPAERHRHFRAIHSVGHPRGIGLEDEPISIEDDAWIAAGAFILKGVTIGSGAIVGAGAVVTRNVESMTIVGGNPARVLRRVKP